MLLWLSIAALVIGIVLSIISKHFRSYAIRETFENSGLVLSLVGGAMTLILVVALCFAWIPLEADMAEWRVEYESLVERYENANWYNRDSIAKEIQDWNIDLTRNQIKQDNFWLDPLIPDVFDQFDLIPIADKEVSSNEDS